MTMSTSLEEIKRKHPNISSHDAEELKIINESLDSLFTRGIFASRDPYILTIPQDEKFAYQHRSSQHARQFAQGTPFSDREREGLQYQTYKYYEPGKSLFKQYPSVDDAETDSSAKPKPPSKTPKKVISFGTYKKQKQGGGGPESQTQGEVSHETADNTPSKQTDSQALESQQAEEPTTELKRKRDEIEEPQANGNDRQSPSKRQRLSDIGEQSPSPRSNLAIDTAGDIDIASRDEARQARDLPKKVSPLPEKQLPTRLSPTLPSSIEDALSDRTERRMRRKDESSNSDDASTGSSHRLSVKHSKALATGVNGDRMSDGEKPESPTHKAKKLRPDPGEHVLKPRDRQAGQAPLRDVTSKQQSPLDSKHGSTREDDDFNRSFKKEKPPSRPEQPRTPLNAALVSPSVRKTLSAAATNGAVRTPSIEPNTPKQAIRPSTRNAAQKAWAAEQKRFEDRGREMKHAASAAAKAGEPRLAAVHALDSFMCYLLGFTCADQVSLTADEPKPAPIKPWRSLGPFFQFVERSCKHYSTLLGITGMLGQAFSAHILELLEASPADLPSRETVIDITTLMRHASKMKTHLHPEKLRIDFPDSWRVGLRHVEDEPDLVAGSLLQGDYQLPTDVLTTPVQAVRASLAVLEEWIAQEDVKVKIELEHEPERRH